MQYPLPALLTALLTVSISASAQSTLTQVDVDQGPSFLIELSSGNGPAGGTDAVIRHVKGPCMTAFQEQFQPRHFRAARTGAPAAILSSPGWGLQQLQSDPGAQWIATSSGLFTESGLFAVPFDVPASAIFSARLDFHYGVDDYLGTGHNAGLYLNELPVPGGSPGAVPAYTAEALLGDLDVTSLIVPGKNWLYVNMTNIGCNWWGGLIFHARLRINEPHPDECQTAVPAVAGVNLDSTNGFTTSATGGSCGVLSDRWYWYVPSSSGSLTVRVEKLGSASSFVPALALFDGSCGALTEWGCAQAPGATSGSAAELTVPATTGRPVLIEVGSTDGATGDYRIILQPPPPSSGAVNPVSGHLYELTPTAVDWVTAKAEAQLKGGYLATITSQQEQDFVEQNALQGNSAWIGLTDELVEGVFVWDNGEPTGSYSNWAAGEPNDAPGTCGEDYGGMFANGEWNDWPQMPSNCATDLLRGLIEVPGPGHPVVSDLGGACGATALPLLVSEPHRIGQNATLGLLEGPPGEAVLLFVSAVPASPTPIGSCTLHLDTGTTGVVAANFLGPYGSATFAVAVPSDPLLVGKPAIWQAQLLLPAGSPLSYSNGLLIVIGN